MVDQTRCLMSVHEVFISRHLVRHAEAWTAEKLVMGAVFDVPCHCIIQGLREQIAWYSNQMMSANLMI